jgi:hypothetical protein
VTKKKMFYNFKKQNELQSFNDVVTQMSVTSRDAAVADVNDINDDSYCVSSGDSSCYELSKSMSDNDNDNDNDVETKRN